MQYTNKKGFTLIEMLVVIAIIAILATGATSVYTSQIQKSRDATRMSAVQSLQSGVEQFYSDKSVYPSPLLAATDADSFSGVHTYTPVFPIDPKAGELGAGATNLIYTYNAGPDDNDVALQTYKLSTAFENAGNRDNKALNTKDNGNDVNRWETGVMSGPGKALNIGTCAAQLQLATADATKKCTAIAKGSLPASLSAIAGSNTNGIFINGN